MRQKNCWGDAVKAEYYGMLEKTQDANKAEWVAKQHGKGKLTAKERLDLLFDKGTFQEIGALAERANMGVNGKKGSMGDGVMTGYGTVNGRLIFAVAQDASVSGGAGGEVHVNKICQCLEMAIDAGVPFVSLNESGGARIEEGISSLASYSRLFYLNTLASGYIPQIAAILGNCAGGASYSPALHDFIFMVKDNSQMYITGPQVIKALTGESVTMEELGGVKIHSVINGQASFVCEDDVDCINHIKVLLDYLPQNCHEKCLVKKYTREDHSNEIEGIVPENKRTPYDVRQVIEKIVDDGSFIEVFREFAPNIVIGLSRIEGRVCGIVANQPNHLGGAIDCDAADKASRFIRFCDCFNIPMITLVDVPAFMPGMEQEKKGILRHGSKLLYAYSEATVPKITLIMRKAYGGAYCAMNSKMMSADVVYAWPICEIAVMGADGAVNVIYRKRIAAAQDPETERKKLIDEYEKKFLNAYYAAAKALVDEIILPRDTRRKLNVALQMLENKRSIKIDKKHGNIPL